MSEIPRDAIEGDSQLSRLYPVTPRDEPPPALDAAIRAAARRAVGAGPRPAGAPFARSWRLPLSIAAVIVLSVSLVIVMREEAPEVAQVPQAAPPAERAAAAVPPGAAEVPAGSLASHAQISPGTDAGMPRRDVPAANETRQRAERNEPERSVAAKPKSRETQAVAPSPALAPVTQDTAGQIQAEPEAAVAESGKKKEDSLARAKSELPPAPVAAAPAAMPARKTAQAANVMQTYANLPPEKWLERIDELRREGKLAEARASLAEFRKRYPDYPLPVALKDGIQAP